MEIPNDAQPSWLIINGLIGRSDGKEHDGCCVYQVQPSQEHEHVSQSSEFVHKERSDDVIEHSLFFFLKNQMINNSARQAFLGPVDAVCSPCTRATRKPNSCLQCNLRQETDDRFRLLGYFANPNHRMVRMIHMTQSSQHIKKVDDVNGFDQMQHRTGQCEYCQVL